MAHRNQTRGAPPPDRAGEWTQLAATLPILNGMVPASDAELPSLGRSRSCSPMIFRVGSHVNFAGVHAGQNREKEMGLADLPIQLRHEKVVNPWSQAWGGWCKGSRIPLAVHQAISPFGSHVEKDVQAVGFEPTRSYLQWILSPPP